MPSRLLFVADIALAAGFTPAATLLIQASPWRPTSSRPRLWLTRLPNVVSS